MIHAEASITIGRSINEVFAFVADQHNAPQWQPSLLKVHRLTDGPIGVGSRHIALRAVMDDQLEIISEYVTFEPNLEIMLTGSDGLVEFRTVYLFETAPDGTRIITRMWTEPDCFTLLDDDELAAALEGDLAVNLHALKVLLENQTTLGVRSPSAPRTKPSSFAKENSE
jgi:uncharacterized membrane protein